MSGTATTRTLWSGTDELAEFDGAGTLQRRVIPGPGIDDKVAVVEATGAVRYFHTDRLGSVVALTDAQGAVTDAYAYSAWGEAKSGVADTGNPWRFTGRYLDAETGLYYYRARYYSARLGQFLETDPIGTKDDPNLYLYVGLDPLSSIDPTGEDTFIVSRQVRVVTRDSPNGSGNPKVTRNTGGKHMFVVTGAHSRGDPNGIRISGGPSSGKDPALVPQQGTGSQTDQDDAAAWRASARGDKTITVVRISSESLPDEIVAAVGNAAVGRPDYDLGVAPGGNDGANSNSFARAIIDKSAEIAGVVPESIPNPDGWHPNIDQADEVQFDESELPKPK